MDIPMKRVVRTLGAILALALALGLLTQPWDTPARAQGPSQDVDYFKLDTATTEPKQQLEPKVEYEALVEQEHPQAKLTQYGTYLRVYTRDRFNYRPVPGLIVHVYDRASQLVAEITSDCSGYVELDGLLPGYYQVIPQSSEQHYVYYRQSPWVYVRSGYRANIYLYSQPAIQLAGIRVNAYDRNYPYSRRYLEGVPFSVYDYDGTLVFSGYTNCSGFVDFYDATPGWYRIVPDTLHDPQATLTPESPTPPAMAAGPAQSYGSEGMWVPVYAGYLVSVDYYLEPSTYPQTTTTPTATQTTTETPESDTPTPTTAATNTPTTPPTNTPEPTPSAPPPPP